MLLLDDGGYVIDDRIEIPGEGSDHFVFTHGWLLEIIDAEEGDYYFISNGEDVRSTAKRFGVFYPSFSITRSCIRSFKGSVHGVGSAESLEGLPRGPFIFETDHDEKFNDSREALNVLARATNPRPIDVNSKPSLITIKAKRLIDENYLAFPSIARIAGRLQVTPEHLSRTFKLDLGLTPSQYLRKLRVADATFRLSKGEPIIDISHDVGYNDLSRFYKQFRKTTNTSPGACRESLIK
jgi:AraC-like DNA-binding protein